MTVLMAGITEPQPSVSFTRRSCFSMLMDSVMKQARNAQVCGAGKAHIYLRGCHEKFWTKRQKMDRFLEKN